MNARLALSTFTLLILGTLVSCQKAPSASDKIVAQDDTSFDNWLTEHTAAFSVGEIDELKTARQQIRYKVMQAHPGLSSAELAEQVYAEINGHTANDVLRESYALQVDRLQTELKNYQPQLEKFQAAAKEGHSDEDQKKYINDSLDRIRRLMGQRNEELARVTARQAELEKQAPAGSAPQK
jgi:hypothetical protein